ncbi:8631_t:CDS:2, partial [Cetraspora pellucida]
EKENMPEVTIETPKGQKSKTAKLEEEDLSSVTSLSNKDQISDEQTKQTTCEKPTSNHDKPNIEYENIPVDSLASLYNYVWANNTDPIDKENKQDFTMVFRKKHRNKSRITTSKVGRTTVLGTSASYTKARGLQ